MVRSAIAQLQHPLDEHDALNLPIAQMIARAQRRPLTQPEFLRLMSLLTTQRIIAKSRETVNGILHEWREQRLVDADRRSIRVHDPQRLRAVA